MFAPDESYLCSLQTLCLFPANPMFVPCKPYALNSYHRDSVAVCREIVAVQSKKCAFVLYFSYLFVTLQTENETRQTK